MEAKDLLAIIPKELAYRGDSVVFFERSNSLYSEGPASNFREFLVDHKIRHNVIYNLDQLSDDYIVKSVEGTLDTILCFETTGVYHELIEKIQNALIDRSNKGYRFKIIECFANEPHFYGIPEEASDSLELFSLDSFSENIEDWELIKRHKRNY